MGGAAEEHIDGGLLDNSAALHDGDAMGDAADDGEVVRDEEHGEVVGRAEVAEEVEDLGLDGDVEGGGWLIGDEEARPVDEGHGDEQALPLSAGELVREVVDPELRVWQGDLVHGGEDTISDGRARQLRLVRLQGFGDLPADGHDWVEGGHGLLKDHGDLTSADLAQVALGAMAEILTLKDDAAGGAGRVGKQAEEGERGCGLAGSGFADEAEGLSGTDLEAEIADRGLVSEADVEAGDLEEGAGHGSILAGQRHGRRGRALRRVDASNESSNV